MIGLTLSVNYLESDAYGGLHLHASGSLAGMKLAYNLSNSDNSCVGAARRRHRTYLQLPF
ncbi:hypothetical protein [Nostoc punctiforme]|jgi:hypothetical protein|uniref:hypothetical protein n=1 Tax=Nostoc punctiforme TaxID=272131 RepID=UPI000045C175|nr:hypothetical protein [Nostoc punctiforme]